MEMSPRDGLGGCLQFPSIDPGEVELQGIAPGLRGGGLGHHIYGKAGLLPAGADSLDGNLPGLQDFRICTARQPAQPYTPPCADRCDHCVLQLLDPPYPHHSPPNTPPSAWRASLVTGTRCGAAVATAVWGLWGHPYSALYTGGALAAVEVLL